MPSVAIKNGGVSNFGNHVSTVVPYVLAFLLNVVFIYLASRAILKLGSRLAYIARALMLLSVLTLIVFISTFPRHYNFTYSDIHDDLGIVLYSYEFLISVWIVMKRPTAMAKALLSMQAIGSMVGLLSALKVIHFLFLGQIVGAAGFGLLIGIILPKVIETELDLKSDKS